MITYREYRRHTNDWTPQDDDLLLTHAGRVRLPKLAARLGRTPNAAKQRLWRHHQSLRACATRRAGMSVADVCEALGVSKNHVRKWLYIGWLTRVPAFGMSKRALTVDPDDLLRFLNERGGLLSYLAPDRDWREEVDAARAALTARYISATDLATALCFHRSHMSYLWRRAGMPAPALVMGGCQPDYFDRVAIRAWRAAHPRYQGGGVI